jgi:hypothetical protein
MARASGIGLEPRVWTAGLSVCADEEVFWNAPDQRLVLRMPLEGAWSVTWDAERGWDGLPGP